jgi:cation diffusion facilitator CzcD-associated flavoprotein CzcO
MNSKESGFGSMTTLPRHGPEYRYAEKMNPYRTAIIIGAGITGIGASYYLGANNISYLVLEGKGDLGGVWNTQRWHGARCDSDIIKYSFSFKPFLSKDCLQNSDEIHRYLHSVVNEFRILENIRFDTLVTKAVFNTKDKRWFIYTNKGVFASQYLFNGNGYFSDTPYVPPFRGSDKFKGEFVHTCNLDGTRTFKDKNVVLIGSGATAISCAPELSLVSKSLTMIQRSPSYIYEISNKVGRLTTLCQELYEHGIKWPVKFLRYGLQLKDDAIFVGFRRFPRMAKWVFKRHWLKAIGRESFQKHFCPKYNPWEQRIPVAIGLKEKIQTQQIIIRTGEIDRFTSSSIVLKDGEEIECEVCVLATGYNLDYLKFEIYVDERKIVTDRINFYKGLMMGSIPNYFHPFGVWHSAWTQTSETVTRFAIKIMSYMKRNNYQMVTLDRKSVDSCPSITPNYIKRHIATLPRFYGSFDLPALDNILSYRFDPSQFHFS